MNFPIIMSLWLMRQGLDDDTDTDMSNASALESAAFALYCIVAAAILCVASAFAWDLLSAFHFFLNKRNQTLSRFRQERQLLFRVREPIPSLSAQTEKSS